MPIPAFIGIASSLAPVVMQGVQSIKQRNAANNLERSNFVPSALREKLDRNRTLAQATMQPGQARAQEIVKETTAAGTTQAMRAASNSSDALNTVAALTAQQNRSMEDIMARGDQSRMQAQMALGSTESEVARQQNQNQRDFLNTKNALLEGADRNMFNAASNAGALGARFSGLGGLPSDQQLPIRRSEINIGRIGQNVMNQGRQQLAQSTKQKLDKFISSGGGSNTQFASLPPFRNVG